MFRLSCPSQVLPLVIAIAIGSCANAAKAADVLEANVPSMTQWCLVRPAAIAGLSDSTFQQAEITAVMLAIGKAGAAIGVPELGVPSVDHTDKIDDQNVNVTYCTNIDTTKSPPAATKISTRKRNALKVVGKLCDGATIDACETELITALQG